LARSGRPSGRVGRLDTAVSPGHSGVTEAGGGRPPAPTAERRPGTLAADRPALSPRGTPGGSAVPPVHCPVPPGITGQSRPACPCPAPPGAAPAVGDCGVREDDRPAAGATSLRRPAGGVLPTAAPRRCAVGGRGAERLAGRVGVVSSRAVRPSHTALGRV